MAILRNILYPFAILYSAIIRLRNKFFDWGFLKSETFPVPVICVGNLNVGGTGKSPMVEYLIRLLKDEYNLATLSRGYKRNTKGFKVVDASDTAKEVGDEPLQFKRKFKNITVAVDENRAHGISELLKQTNAPEIVILDDAFQHRYVKPSFTILLTAYKNLYSNDIMLPTGNLREPKSGAKRADVIVVTKSPENLGKDEKIAILSSLNTQSHQKVFFSTIGYSKTISNRISQRYLEALNANSFILVTGIANPKPLVAYLKSKDLEFQHLAFSDHHNFSEAELKTLKKHPFILTTEKDYVRLHSHFKRDQIFYLPIESTIDRPEDFKNAVSASF